MKDYARKLYSSKAWKETRAAYAKSRGGLCERCLSAGLVVPGEIVHHRRHITAANVDDPAITLSWDNLELVCWECHAAIHERDIHGGRKNQKKRYIVSADGKISAVDAPP